MIERHIDILMPNDSLVPLDSISLTPVCDATSSDLAHDSVTRSKAMLLICHLHQSLSTRKLQDRNP